MEILPADLQCTAVVFYWLVCSCTTSRSTSWEPNKNIRNTSSHNMWNFGLKQSKHVPVTFKLEPKQRIMSACCAASAAPFQLRGCSSVPRSPKCTIVSLSSALQCGHRRPVQCLCRAVRSVTSNNLINSCAGEQETQTCKSKNCWTFTLQYLLLLNTVNHLSHSWAKACILNNK